MVDVLIIGAGMYVCGRGTDTYGTILPAVMEAKKQGYVGKISVVSTCKKSVGFLSQKLKEINRLMGTNINIDTYPKEGKDRFSYRNALDNLSDGSCVILSVPDHLHYQIAKELIEAKKNNLVVKPLTSKVDENIELIKLANKNNVYGAVEFHKRYDLANLKVKKIINDGNIGDLLYTIVEYSQRKIMPEEMFKNWIKETNIFQYLAVHYVDIIYFITRAKPLRVSAVGQMNSLANKGINTYDSIQAILEWENTEGKLFTSTFLVNWIDPSQTSAMSYQSIKFIGTEGRYESDQKNRGNQVITEDGIEDINPYFTQIYPTAEGFEEFRGYGIDSILTFIKDCNDLNNKEVSVNELQSKRPSFSEALISTAVVEATNRSLMDNGRWKKIELPVVK
ncbi:gfo/Idh/MocA family oxidoreductase [Iocasia frigidifontis]|uniref:Gfo/Idh/MocA family oxidoreductase n=1 Tax=Iocasia fonsfrigidae TaxID=2682810 RepID=A0A8A7K5H1_9FIRM|nr:Gfo/Idh/MocA family oxidoreductase [Iocasia fonsfrigidae]QTL96946.1 gfo/Idh/MocA family oxidoreductase [Iocasia fonsfrigidae]